MSALAVAGVTAVLRSMLESWLNDQNANAALGGANAEVTAVAPDTIELTGADARPRLNLYMYQVSPNSGWRNANLPSTDVRGARSANPPLALDLRYLLTAYGPQEFQAEVLLGYGMQLLHMVAVPSRQQIEDRLPPALQSSHLGQQAEMVKITQEMMSTEELSKLWAAFQARYRPTAAYVASVVLIKSPSAGRVVLPVLTRGPIDEATGRERGVVVQPDLFPPLPGITAVRPPHSQPGAVLGDVVTVEGHRLNGTNRAVRLENRQLGVELEIDADPGAEAGRLHFTVPDAPADLPVGTYSLQVLVQPPGETAQRVSNALSLTVLPNILTDLPLDVDRDGEGTATVNLDFSPEIRPSQRAVLVVGAREVVAEPIDESTGALSFGITDAPIGTFLLRLRIDGYDSLLVDYEATPPAFLDRRITIS
jgi:hypothetical protein